MDELWEGMAAENDEEGNPDGLHRNASIPTLFAHPNITKCHGPGAREVAKAVEAGCQGPRAREVAKAVEAGSRRERWRRRWKPVVSGRRRWMVTESR